MINVNLCLYKLVNHVFIHMYIDFKMNKSNYIYKIKLIQIFQNQNKLKTFIL